MNRAESEIMPRREITFNPYEPSREASSHPPSDSSSERNIPRWRIYLLVHLGTVVFMAAMYLMGNSGWNTNFLNAPRMESIDRALNVLLMLLMVHNAYVSPILVIALFVKGWNRDRRYASAGIVELLLMGTFFFVCLPMVQ